MRKLRTLALGFVIPAFIGCASYTSQTKEMRSAIYDGDFSEALSALKKSSLAEQKASRFLFLVEKATLLGEIGQLDSAQSVWEQAYRLSQELYTKSISKELGTYVVSENLQDYAGEDYERVFIPFMKSLHFLKEKKEPALTLARVEAKRMIQLLKEINSIHNDDKNSYQEDGLAHFLVGLIFESLGELDSAVVAYKAALRAYEGSFGKFVPHPPRSLIQSLQVCLHRLRRSNELDKLKEDYAKDLMPKPEQASQQQSVVAIQLSGLIPRKIAKEFAFRVGSQIIRSSFPVLSRAPYATGRNKLTVGKKTYVSELASDLGKIAAHALNDKKDRMILKHGARLLAKGQVAEQARQQLGPFAGLIVNIFNIVTETADTRSWSSLPGKIYVNRVWIEKGVKKARLTTNSNPHSFKKLSPRLMQFLIDRGS